MQCLVRFCRFPAGAHCAGRPSRLAPQEKTIDASFAGRVVAGLAILFVLAFGPVAGGIHHASAAETPCPSADNPAPCQADMDDRMAVYARGRDAYDNARTSGDFSEALALARQLAALGDKNGERLLKMVYLQLGWGAHRDYVQAYGWLSEGIAGGADYLARWRQILTEKMTADQLAEAKKTAGN